MAGSRVFKKIQQRAHTADGPVGLHTMVLATTCYLAEVNQFLQRLASQPGCSDAVRQDLEPVLEEYRNFETALMGFCKPRNGGRR